jgi:ribosome recycling factor
MAGTGARDEAPMGETSMQTVLKDLDSKMTAAIDTVSREFASVRTGRASTALLDTVRVDYYGTMTAVNQMASVSVPDARTLVIQPWETNQLQAIEKAIIKSDLGLNPVNDGKTLRLTLPTLTEERRKQLAKTVHKIAEEGRIAVRNVRREANDKLKAMAKDKKVAEDEERRGHDQIQKTTDRFIAKVDELLKKKEQEILSF